MLLHLWANKGWIVTSRSEGPGERVVPGTPEELQLQLQLPDRCCDFPLSKAATANPLSRSDGGRKRTWISLSPTFNLLLPFYPNQIPRESRVQTDFPEIAYRGRLPEGPRQNKKKEKDAMGHRTCWCIHLLHKNLLPSTFVSLTKTVKCSGVFQR